MKSDRIKKIILAILALVLVYVWIGNLSVFTQMESSRRLTGDTASHESGQNRAKDFPAYKPAQINPFRKPGVFVPTAPTHLNAGRKPQPVPAKPADQYKLTGVVDRRPYSQIVLLDQSGQSLIRGLGDSLGVWELTHIFADMAVFSCEKYRDTLRLVK